MASIAELALRQIIIGKLTDHGLTSGEAARIASQPWVMDIAKAKLSGTVPPGMTQADMNRMSNMGPKDVEAYRAQAKSSGVGIEDIFKSQFLGSPYKGQVASAIGGGIKAAYDAAPAMGNGTPNAAGGIQGILADVPQVAAAPSVPPPPGSSARDAGWLANYPSGRVPSKADLDTAIRTVYGEASGGGPAEMQAVAQTIRNRSLETGQPLTAVSKAKGQFEPYMHADSRARMANLGGDTYQQVADLVTPILTGEKPDTTGGVDHFYAPAAQKALGRGKPGFDDGTGVMYGRQKFFSAPHGKPYGSLPLPPVLGQAGAPDALPPGGGIAGMGLPYEHPAPSAPAPLVASVAPFRATGTAAAGGVASPGLASGARSPVDVSGYAAAGQPWGQAPAYANAQFKPTPPVPSSLARFANRSAPGAPMSQMPPPLSPQKMAVFTAMQAAKQGPGASGMGSFNPGLSVMGSASGGAPWGKAPAYANAQFGVKPPALGVPPILAGLMGRSPIPPPAIMSAIPKPPVGPTAYPGIGTSMINKNYGPPLPSGLASSPMSMMGSPGGMGGMPLPSHKPMAPMSSLTQGGYGTPGASAAANGKGTGSGAGGGSAALQSAAAGASSVANILVAQLDAAMHAQEAVHGNRYTALATLAPNRPKIGGMSNFSIPFRPQGW